MAKHEEKTSLDQEEDDYDVLEDIQPEDFVFVFNGHGQLKGISFPEEMLDDAEINPTVEEIIKFLLDKNKESRPPDSTLH